MNFEDTWRRIGTETWQHQGPGRGSRHQEFKHVLVIISGKPEMPSSTDGGNQLVPSPCCFWDGCFSDLEVVRVFAWLLPLLSNAQWFTGTYAHAWTFLCTRIVHAQGFYVSRHASGGQRTAFRRQLSSFYHMNSWDQIQVLRPWG